MNASISIAMFTATTENEKSSRWGVVHCDCPVITGCTCSTVGLSNKCRRQQWLEGSRLIASPLWWCNSDRYQRFSYWRFLLLIMLNFAEIIHIAMTVPILIFMFASTWVFNVTISIGVFMKRTTTLYIHWSVQVVMVAALLSLAAALFVILKMTTIFATGDRGWQRWLLFRLTNQF